VTDRPKSALRAPEILERKRDGKTLTRTEIDFLIAGYTRGEIPDYQMAAFAIAVHFRGMSDEETTDLTRAMLHSREILDPPDLTSPKVDEHPPGGLGDTARLSRPPHPVAVIPRNSPRAVGLRGTKCGVSCPSVKYSWQTRAVIWSCTRP